MTNLRERKCVPCRGDTPTLSEEKIDQYLELVQGWTRSGQMIEKTFTFRNFREALSFFNKVAEVAEEEDHHPDMGIYQWRRVRLSLTTHAAHGLTENDFVMAAKIEHLDDEGVPL